METTSVFLHSRATAFDYIVSTAFVKSISQRPSNKHLQCNQHISGVHLLKHPKSIQLSSTSGVSSYPLTRPLGFTRTHRLHPLQCSYSASASASASSSPQNPLIRTFKSLSLDSVKKKIQTVSPFNIIKWSGILSIAIAATKRTVNLMFNPFFWMYFSWTWLFWPWFVAIALAIYGVYSFRKHSKGEANILEQLAIVTSTFTWLTLVPPAYFNGYLEGWPFVFFLAYHYFFFFNVSVRKRMYGDYYMRRHDPKWDIDVPKWRSILFCVGVMIGHWLAAFEGPELHLISGGWTSNVMWILIVMTLLMQYNATFYLAKYSEKVVVPTAVVQFGPYRWVRHPLYASTMLLFAIYCIALRAPMSMLFVVGVCLMYYAPKAKVEEGLMIDTFGKSYLEYMSKVRYKFIPLVY